MKNIGLILLNDDIGFPSWMILLVWLFYFMIFLFICFIIYTVVKYFQKK